MIDRFEEALGQKGYRRVKSQPEWVHTFVLQDPEDGAGRARRAVICIDYRSDYSMAGGQIPLIRARIREYFGMPIDQDRMLVVIFTRDPERARPLSMENPYCWIIDEREEKLILYENQPSDFDGMRSVAERLHMESAAGPEEEEREEEKKRQTFNGYNFQRRQSRWSLKEELRWIFLGQKKHFVTAGLVLINVLAYFILSARGDLSDSRFMVSVGGMYPPRIIDRGEWWRLITCIFLHFDLSHLLNNMLILYFLGKWVEETLGSGRFAGVYLGSGILGAAVSMYSCMVTGDIYVSAGASGAVYGLMGSLAVLILLHRGRFKGLSIQRMAFMIFLCVYQSMTSIGVDNMGHLGGLFSGAVLTMILYGISYLAGWENA